MDKKTEALKLALEALEYLRKPIAQGWEAETQQEKRDQAITAIREALAEQPPCKTGSQCTSKCEQCRYKYECDKAEQPAQQQEPVGRIVVKSGCAHFPISMDFRSVPDGEYNLYTSPPASKPWVGLTQKDKKEIERLAVYVEGAISLTEAKLKEKNA